MSDIRVPELGESIVEATVLNWLKQLGDPIQAGEAVLELETDKVNVEVMAEEPGVLDAILKQPGDSVTVGETVGTVRSDTTVAGDTTVVGDTTNAGDRTVAGDTPQMIAEAPATPLDSTPVHSSSAVGMPLRPTPSMRKQARENGVELVDSASDSASPAGLSGRTGGTNATPVSAHAVSASPAISSGMSSIDTGRSGQPNLDASPSATPVRTDELRERMTRRRLTIAKRLVEAQHTAAMLTTFNEVDMSAIFDLRGRRKEGFKDQHGVSLGFMSFFTKAAVAALKKFPRLNAQIEGEDMILKHHYDIGVAVSTDGGLVVPVVREADRRTFAEIESEIARLATKARNNTLGLEDLQGGTFTITNGGVFGSLFSTPILNAPQVGILGMHGIKQRPCAVDGRVEVRPMMYIALSYDHRIVDGAEAVQFLDMVKNLVEDPETLLLES